MKNKLIYTVIGILLFTNLYAYSEDCETGYACPIDKIQQQNTQNDEMKDQQNKKKKTVKAKKEKKKKGKIFVDGGEYNSPAYTEMFTKYDFFFQ